MHPWGQQIQHHNILDGSLMEDLSDSKLQVIQALPQLTAPNCGSRIFLCSLACHRPAVGIWQGSFMFSL
jgi:hypothetical protein